MNKTGEPSVMMPSLSVLMMVLALSSTFSVQSLAADAPPSNLEVTRQVYDDLLARKDEDSASLTLFTRLLPKGGDLHHHFSGSIYAETYLDWVQAGAFCIFDKTSADIKITEFMIAIAPATLTEAQRASCKSADQIRRDGEFYRDLLQSWSIQEFVTTESASGDKHFFDAFQYFSKLAGVSQRQGLAGLKERAIAENVSYIETMLTSSPPIKSAELEAILPDITDGNVIKDWEERLEKAYLFLNGMPDSQEKVHAYVQAIDDAAAGLDDDNFTIRFLAYANRMNPPDDVFSRLYTAFQSAAASDKIVGVNIVGPENAPISVRDYSLHMKMFGFFSRKYPHVRIALHAGELSPGMLPPEDMSFHIREAVEVAKADRIGHGVAVAHEANAQKLLEEMRDESIAVEINLTSNYFILGIDASEHPLHLYRKYSVPFVISTDDSGILRSTLSSEYLKYILQFQPGYDELKNTVARSIEYAFVPQDVKEKLLRRLQRQFDDFEAEIARSSKYLRN